MVASRIQTHVFPSLGALHVAERGGLTCAALVCARVRSYIQEKAQRNMVEYYRRLRPAGPHGPPQ